MKDGKCAILVCGMFYCAFVVFLPKPNLAAQVKQEPERSGCEKTRNSVCGDALIKDEERNTLKNHIMFFCKPKVEVQYNCWTECTVTYLLYQSAYRPQYLQHDVFYIRRNGEYHDWNEFCQVFNAGGMTDFGCAFHGYATSAETNGIHTIGAESLLFCGLDKPKNVSRYVM